MGKEVQRAYGKLISLGTTKYIPCIDWEKNLVQQHDRPAPIESIEYPRFLYSEKDRPIFSN